MSGDIIKKLEENLLLTEVRNSKERNESKIKLFDFELKKLSEGAALALYKTTSSNQIALRSSIWKKHSKYGWQILFHQGTLKE